MNTQHHIDGWTFTRHTCAEGQALVDELDAALAPVRAWDPTALVHCPYCAQASGAIKAYFRHINTCPECWREWRRDV